MHSNYRTTAFEIVRRLSVWGPSNPQAFHIHANMVLINGPRTSLQDVIVTISLRQVCIQMITLNNQGSKI